MKNFIGLFLTIMIFLFSAKANNIKISNLSTTQDSGNIIISFSLSWENSWRSAGTGNYDGAWVFFKYKDSDGAWKPVRFSGSNVTPPTGYTVDISNNGAVTGMGAFVYRSSLGFGSVNITNIKAGLQPIPGTFEVKGFAVEMVYIPQGSFYAGDSTGIAGGSYQNGNSLAPYKITGAGSTVTLGNTLGQLSGESEQGLSVTLSNFPDGYNAYWMMKYELSQGAYRDFFNTLTYDQQKGNMVVNVNPDYSIGTLLTPNIRGRIEISTSGIYSSYTPAIVGCDLNDNGIYNEPADGEWLAMGYLRWLNAAAYLDWACLRPMTELEYEKACRGPLPARAGEFAWGKITITNVWYHLQNDGLVDEFVANAGSSTGNAAYLSTDSSAANQNLRGGIFATPISNRVSSGAGYYGIMEMSGNQYEYCVTTWNKAGRSFTGKHGNGILTSTGLADENFWPGINGNNNASIPNQPYSTHGASGEAGFILRGGSTKTAADLLRISKRTDPSSQTLTSSTYAFNGIRGVRDAN